MPVVLFEPSHRDDLFPFTLTRTVSSLRKGIMTIGESWQRIIGDSLRINTEPAPGDLLLSAALLPDPEVWSEVSRLPRGEALFHDDIPIARYHGDEYPTRRALGSDADVLRYPWQLVQWNDKYLRIDFALLTAGRISQPIPEGNRSVNPEEIFIEEGAKVHFSVLNASTGPIYIGRNAQI